MNVILDESQQKLNGGVGKFDAKKPQGQPAVLNGGIDYLDVFAIKDVHNATDYTGRLR